MARHKNGSWNLPDNPADWGQVRVALLMDIRDELMIANELLRDIAAPMRCSSFLKIPQKLDSIRRNTTRKARKKKEVV